MDNSVYEDLEWYIKASVEIIIARFINKDVIV